MRLPSGQRSTEWVARLPGVLAALNGEVTRLTCKKPSDAIKAKTLRRSTQKPSSVVPGRPVGLKEQKLPSGVRYLYQPGELESGRRRATDPVFNGSSARTLGDQVRWARVVLLAGWASAGLRARRAPHSATGHSASSEWGSQALSAAAPRFRLHSRQVSLTLSWMWSAELSNRSTLNCWGVIWLVSP